ncbi:AMSH-like protease [Brienomyrus brachyistius]|uniref:AMSH-like protease n=1 Tax=Brienomyrus brachyistius TaxID=42636 RepID=UPI0020B3653F|nr:AMSH-like protease [Brienomyrus brachyistius]XP_048843930.1 AMSH-like protease [Brienomyrus brachyistius]XP_048843931.1 AMSH-like protease [Brienomyrus brachyistius]XP_048843932.1 AMSH-like protease [Brienomyrus brachyistius]XP_048861365.1 AMSH-like protease [Brienomyrus brachyistius]XP_048861366.1 AMSH-like protease [Brienomyrus brachyistius]XP_048861367.1 AMSH-like protease [Brienomyrus brachyistius]XP_048861368.1 AMSH-like protease [Brienomyrus brachyistius]
MDGRSDPPVPQSSMDQSFSFSSLKKLAAEPDHTDVTLSAAERVRALSKMGCNIEINEDITPRRYFRSGVEMERMAAVYLEEGSLENAFVLYNKFITLFVEKLPSHRDYQQCSVPEKQVIMKKLQDVAFPRKDQLKKLLHEKYNREHMEYVKSQHVCAQSQAAEVCDQQLQRLSLLEEERQRVAQLRRMQIESEQFRYFEDQLRRQELANRKDGAALKVQDQTDGTCLSRTPKNHVSLGSNRSKQAVPINKPTSTLGAVQNQRVDGLRRVVISRDLTYKFLLLADGNTARGIETCGVLCGRLTHNEFVLTHVIIPKQTAGPDYCDMENVEELFSFQDQHGLLTLGWIHTHPTQTAFLSSVDLHTHCSYQLMLPEAIAIVCAPKHNDTGVFRLTSPGMAEVGNCRMKGFHPHSKDPPLFSICKHVVVKDTKTMVLDLR